MKKIQSSDADSKDGGMKPTDDDDADPNHIALDESVIQLNEYLY